MFSKLLLTVSDDSSTCIQQATEYDMNESTQDVGLSRDGERIPPAISMRTATHQRELKRWRRANKGVPWGTLLRRALDRFFDKNKAA